MSCTSITSNISFNMSSSGIGGQPTLDTNSVVWITSVTGAVPSAFSWSATLNDVADGILEIVVTNVSTSDGTAFTDVSLAFCFLWKRQSLNAVTGPITCFCARALLTTSLFSPTRTMTAARSNTRAVSTRAHTRRTEQTCLGTLATSGRAGPIGPTERT
jgi:hypothetical protein